MYGKKVFATLVAFVCLFGLSGCGGGGGGNGGLSIHEYDYFPELNIPTVEVTHGITRSYGNNDELNDFVNDFKAKGPYHASGDTITRYDPMGDGGPIAQATTYAVSAGGHFLITMNIDINGADTITRDDNLFEVIFGDTNAPISGISVTKAYSSDQTTQLEAYGNSLSGFQKTNNRMWIKYAGDTTYVWSYHANGKVAYWQVSKDSL